MKTCLATVSTDNFLPGTLVMLYSYLKCNPWFQGDIIIIHDALSHESRQILTQCFDRVRFLPISPRLKLRLQKLIAFSPDLTSRVARFYSIELFRLKGYNKILFCDSDLLFCKPIDVLFKSKHAFICCGDGAHYRSNGRDTTSFNELTNPSKETAGSLHQTFNAGFLLIDELLLKEIHYAGLLELLSEKNWKQIESGHTDQVLYNLYFAGQQTLVGCEHNYLLLYRSAIYTSKQVRLTEAKVLHFNGPTKPWLLKLIPNAAQQDAAFIQALKLWYTAYIECLQNLHIKAALRSGHTQMSFDQEE